MTKLTDNTREELARTPINKLQHMYDKFGLVVECEDGKPARSTVEW